MQTGSTKSKTNDRETEKEALVPTNEQSILEDSDRETGETKTSNRKTKVPADASPSQTNAAKVATSNTDEKNKHLKKKVVIFVLSHVGLVALVIVYTIMGGFLFRHLEEENETRQRTQVSRNRAYFITKIWNMTTEQKILFEPNWTVFANEIMVEYQEYMVAAIKVHGWDGRAEQNPDVKWSLAGSLLYSVTVLTTIGYGNIAPKTVMGRIGTMLYALPGIPLTLLCLSTIGSTWATCFRFFYSSISGYCACRITLTKIPFIIIGHDPIDAAARKKKQVNVRVPLFVSLLIIGGYIAAGAFLFSVWEEDWDFLIAAYFCFVTLSTIGFGDYVFGIGKELGNTAKLVTSGLYLLMGLSIIAMCFNLMQEEVKEKFLRLGKYFGFIDKKRRIKRQDSLF